MMLDPTRRVSQLLDLEEQVWIVDADHRFLDPTFAHWLRQEE